MVAKDKVREQILERRCHEEIGTTTLNSNHTMALVRMSGPLVLQSDNRCLWRWNAVDKNIQQTLCNPLRDCVSSFSRKQTRYSRA